MKPFREIYSVFLLLFLIHSLGYSQTELYEVCGKVMDVDSNGIRGANIIMKNSNVGSVTDFNGEFCFKVPKDTSIIISYTGYSPIEYEIKNDFYFEIILKSGSIEVEEVVVPPENEYEHYEVMVDDLEEINIPTLDWPPPTPSARDKISKKYFKDCVNLGCVDSLLIKALDANGYHELSYLSVPNGFSIVTRLEKIYKDGTPTEIPERWEVQSASYGFSLTEIIKSLLVGFKGYYRTIVFIITDKRLKGSSEELSQEEAQSWYESGLFTLPEEIKDIEYKKHKVFALIYEFTKKDTEEIAQLSDPSMLTGKIHLEKSNILPWLQENK